MHAAQFHATRLCHTHPWRWDLGVGSWNQPRITHAFCCLPERKENVLFLHSPPSQRHGGVAVTGGDSVRTGRFGARRHCDRIPAPCSTRRPPPPGFTCPGVGEGALRWLCAQQVTQRTGRQTHSVRFQTWARHRRSHNRGSCRGQTCNTNKGTPPLEAGSPNRFPESVSGPRRRFGHRTSASLPRTRGSPLAPLLRRSPRPRAQPLSNTVCSRALWMGLLWTLLTHGVTRGLRDCVSREASGLRGSSPLRGCRRPVPFQGRVTFPRTAGPRLLTGWSAAGACGRFRPSAPCEHDTDLRVFVLMHVSDSSRHTPRSS